MNPLEQRKRALVAKSEIYRQTLHVEIQNLRLCSIGLRQKLNRYRALFSVVPIAGSLAGILSGGLFGRRRKPRWLRLLGTGILGWRLYRRFGPFLQSGFQQWFAPNSRYQTWPEEREDKEESPETNT
jgi:hypothetical protein